MSGRTKKTTTTTTTVVSSKTAASTPASSSSGVARTPGSSARPPSPTMISRIQEKNELASLNDRLASYIERVRQLESENSKLTRIVQTQEDSVTKETTKIKSLFENELASARKLLDEMAKEKAKLQVEVGGLRKEVEELREKLRTKEKDLSATEKKLMSAESQVTDLQARLNDAVNQRRYWEDEYNKLKKEFDAMTKNLAALKKNLEEETVNRVDLENRMQSLREDATFKAQLHEQELNESVCRKSIVIEEVDSRLQEEYDSKLREALQQMRAENDEQIRLMRGETESVFEKKIAELRDLASRNEGSSEKSSSEIRSLKKRVDELNSEISKLTSQNHNHEARVRDLENQLKHEKDDHASTRDSLNAQIRHLKNSLEEQLHEYKDLMDVKIQLDTEIAAYRKLLESEESRLKMPGTPGRTPYRSGTPGESSRKRKRVDLESSIDGASTSLVREAASSADYVVSASAKDALEVREIDTDGKYIKVFNTSSDKDMPIGGWQLRHTAGDNETSFKFHRSVIVKPGMTVTVWSSDSGQTHTPPAEILMKGQTWFAGDVMKTILLDQKGEEMASLEMKKSAIRTSSTYSRSDAGASESQQMSSKGSKGWLSFLSLIS